MYTLGAAILFGGLACTLFIKLKAANHKICVLLEKIKFSEALLTENQTKVADLEVLLEASKSQKQNLITEAPVTNPTKKRRYYRKPKQ
jgi:hypothetical protein